MRDGLQKEFDLSKFEYYLDFILVPVAIIGLLCIASNVFLFMVGFVLWTLIEYWIHRSIFHGPTRYEPMHQMHHRLPKDMIGINSIGTFSGFLFIGVFFWFLVGIATFALIAGLMAGYVFYCVIHLVMHHGNRTNFNPYTEFMFRHHAGHHRGGQGNFGVTSPIWDVVFGSFRKS
jgi:dihydroceramide fatty acyl 2-hydroxylase